MTKIVMALLVCGFALPVLAQDCRSVLGLQTADVASLKRVEREWSDAFMHGKPEYIACLLAPDYASVSPKGVHDLSWEVEHARKNKGSSAPIPDVPGTTYQVHGSTGVVRFFHPADGKQPASYGSDIFSFQDGAWRALYSQHTYVESGMAVK
jgi:hypothetical protein